MEFLASDGVNPRPTAGGTPMMVQRHCHLNQPLQELLRRPGCGAPYVFQDLMRLKKLAVIEQFQPVSKVVGKHN
jgi:hypothetical protein